MKQIIYIMAIIVGCAFTAHADDVGDPKSQLIKAIKVTPKCDEKTVTTLLKQTPLDEDIIFETMKNGCASVFADQEKFKAWLSSENRIHGLHVEQKYMTYFNTEVLSPAKQKIEGGGVFNDDDSSAAANYGFGIASCEMTVKAACDIKSKNTDLCSDLKKVEDAKKEYMALWDKSQKNYDRKNQGSKTGISRVKDWGDRQTQEAFVWKLTQIAKGYAIYSYQDGYDYLLAVKRNSIKKNVYPGMTLLSSVDCVKFISDQTWENDRGFPIKAKTYEAVPCPK